MVEIMCPSKKFCESKYKSYALKRFISHSVFYWKIHLVLDRDTFRLELDYRSIMHILVKVPSINSGTRMVLIPVRVQILSLGMVA